MRLFLSFTVVALLAVAAADATSHLDSEIYSVAADGTGRTNLTRSPAAESQPAVSPDGKRVAFVSARDGDDAIYLMNVDGSGQEQLVGPLSLTPGYRLGALAWSPTGRRLAFTSTQPPVGSLFESSLNHVVDLSGRSVRLIGGIGCARGGPTFSADGRFVAYGVAYCRSAGEEVRVVRASDGRAELTVSGKLVGWAPRGHRLLYLRRTRNPRIAEVATVDRSSRERWVLHGVSASAAAWSPNGTLIAFVRRTGLRPGVYVVRPGGQRPRRLVALAGGSSISWSPNGAWLALSTSLASSQSRVTTYVARASGKGLRRIGRAGAHPVWSRNSRHFALVGPDDTARVVSPPDPSARRVTDPALEAVGHIVWGAGSRLLYTASGRAAPLRSAADRSERGGE